MRRGAFTLIEVMAVVALLGLTAGAVTWSFAEQVRSASNTTVRNQIIHADHMARLAAQRLGRPCSLRFDIAAQRLLRVTDARLGAVTAEESHPVRLSGCRMDRIVVAGEAAEVGVVEVPFSTAGHSPSYAVRLALRQGNNWLVFCGMTGQMTLIENEHEAKNLLSLLGAARTDAP